jgi:putative spermidine/putrescine transport system permease protein
VTTEPGPPARRWRPRRGLRIALLLAPALSLVVVLFLGGFLLAIAQSLGLLPLIGESRLSLDGYRAMLDDPAFRAGFLLTFRIATVSTVIAAVLAVAAALLVRGTRRGRRAVTWLFQLNLSVPHVVGASAMLLLLSQSGVVSRLAHAVGLTDSVRDFPQLVAGHSSFAIVAEYVWKEVPFIGIVVLAVLAADVEALEDVARTLGAGPWQRFRHVVLPLLTPAVLSTSVIVFAFTFGSYEVPFLLGRSYPTTLPVVAYRAYTDVDLDARPEAMAVCVVIAVLVGALVLAYLRLLDRWMRRS